MGEEALGRGIDPGLVGPLLLVGRQEPGDGGFEEVGRESLGVERSQPRHGEQVLLDRGEVVGRELLGQGGHRDRRPTRGGPLAPEDLGVAGAHVGQSGAELRGQLGAGGYQAEQAERHQAREPWHAGRRGLGTRPRELGHHGVDPIHDVGQGPPPQVVTGPGRLGPEGREAEPDWHHPEHHQRDPGPASCPDCQSQGRDQGGRGDGGEKPREEECGEGRIREGEDQPDPIGEGLARSSLMDQQRGPRVGHDDPQRGQHHGREHGQAARDQEGSERCPPEGGEVGEAGPGQFTGRPAPEETQDAQQPHEHQEVQGGVRRPALPAIPEAAEAKPPPADQGLEDAADEKRVQDTGGEDHDQEWEGAGKPSAQGTYTPGQGRDRDPGAPGGGQRPSRVREGVGRAPGCGLLVEPQARVRHGIRPCVPHGLRPPFRTATVPRRGGISKPWGEGRPPTAVRQPGPARGVPSRSGRPGASTGGVDRGEVPEAPPPEEASDSRL